MSEQYQNIELKKCPFCHSSRVKLVEDERQSVFIHCSGCHWTFLPRESWDTEETIEKYNTRSNGILGDGIESDDDIEELLAQCLRFREGLGSNTSLYPLEE